MAKTQKGKRKAAGRSKNSTGRRATHGARKGRGPRSQVLPGMSQVRNSRLDAYCEAIGEDRQTLASAKADEQGSIQGALKEMKGKQLSTYKHAGVELAFVPGADKLRVRLTKAQSDGSSEAEPELEEESDEGAGEAASVA
jgi:hypothetical protein